MSLTCLVIKIENNSLDALKVTFILYIPLFIKQIIQIKSVNTYSNEGLNWNLNETIKNYKVIFGWHPGKIIHTHVFLKSYVFDVRDPVKVSPFYLALVPRLLMFQINLDYTSIVSQQRDDRCGNQNLLMLTVINKMWKRWKKLEALKALHNLG